MFVVKLYPQGVLWKRMATFIDDWSFVFFHSLYGIRVKVEIVRVGDANSY